MTESIEKVGDVTHVYLEHDAGTLDEDLKLLAFATSQRSSPMNTRQQSDRWTEIRLYRSPYRDADKLWTYYVRTSGCTRIPGEEQFERVEQTNSVDTVIEVLTHRTDRGASLPRVSIRILTEASARDEDILDAWTEIRDLVPAHRVA